MSTPLQLTTRLFPATARRHSRAAWLALLFLLTLTLSMAVQAQFSYTKVTGTITITGYTGGGGNLTIPSALEGLPVTVIGEYAFQKRSNLTRVIIPDSITYIGILAFSGCTGLTSVTIPASVTSVGVQVFSGCTGLTSFTVDADNSAYASMAGVLFNKSLTFLIQYPPARAGTAYTLPDSVTAIGDLAFSGCTGLTSVTIGNSVTYIGVQAFVGCTGLTSVTIPDHVTSIGGGAFSGCTGLTRVYFEGNAPQGVSVFNDTPATIYYLEGTQGWDATFAGRPTAPWNARIVTDDGMFGLPAGQIGFTLAGVGVGALVVEASESLGQPIWTPVSTNALSAQGKARFIDPASADRPGRFYRVRVP